MEAAALSLPDLREDIALHPGTDGADGTPSWTLYDPLRHRYFSIDNLSFEMLARWPLGEGRTLLEAVRSDTFHEPTESDLAALIDFVRRNGLTDMRGPEATQFLLRQREGRKEAWHSWLLHRYLFFRIPILKPQRLLDRLSPLVAPLYTRTALLLFLAVMASGLYLAGRQWETFLATFTAFGTWQGKVALLVGIGLSKLAHEFGHALTLRRFGGRVPTMGLAFLVMMPVLYTDTGDSWRLRYRRQRLAVGAAGMVVELGLASLALLLWSFAPEGGIKAALFILATTVWIATLSINASPFMRFDGYYLLSDHLDVPNLQDRAFALGRWRLREFLFGLGEAPPEDFPPRRRRLLIAYAYATWIYRLVLFLGIALLVYHFFFKLLGILLFAVEIWYFVARPIVAELREWWRERRSLRGNRALVRSLILLAGLMALLAVPWRGTIAVPAALDSAGRQEIFPPGPARIEAVLATSGSPVAKGQTLYRLASPKLAFERAQAEGELAIARLQQEQVAVTRERSSDAALARQQAVLLASKIRGIDEKIALLELTAPFDGQLVDVPDAMRVGHWVNESSSLGLVIAGRGGVLTGYAPQEEVELVRAGAALAFFPEDPLGHSLEGRIGDISPLAAKTLPDPLLASVHGGSVDVLQGRDGTLTPVVAAYRVTADLPGVVVSRRQRGTLRIEGEPASLISRFLHGAVMVLMRESGF
jgi:putative peptide zinc metalloprotease protein